MQLDQLLDLLRIVGVSLGIATFFKSKSTWLSLVEARTPIREISSLVRNTFIAHTSLCRYHPLSVLLKSVVWESGTGDHSISSILIAKVCIRFIYIFIDFLRFELLNEAVFRLSQSWPINIIERSRPHDYGIFFSCLFKSTLFLVCKCQGLFLRIRKTVLFWVFLMKGSLFGAKNQTCEHRLLFCVQTRLRVLFSSEVRLLLAN